MAEVKLTTEWLEEEALAFDEQAAAHRRNATEGGISQAAQRMQGDRAWDCNHRAEVYRLAARALRAGEWAQDRLSRESRVDVEHALECLLDILEGREP